MERLTHKARYEAGYELNKGVKDWQAADRLGAHENTGLTPDQIMELKERDTAKAPEVFDGHWYKCPRCGMYAGGIKGDFCHRCGQRLNKED